MPPEPQPFAASAPLPPRVARDRIAADHAVLAEVLDGIDDADLARPYQVDNGPMGDFCTSLHDLLAHVMMWDEIGLAVLTELRAGRQHWSTRPEWEQPETARALNRAGVLAGRELPAALLRARLELAHVGLIADLSSLEPQWGAAAPHADAAGPVELGGAIQAAMTVPNRPAYWHAAIHLGRTDLLAAR